MPTVADRRRERILASPQFHDGRFRNTSGVGPDVQGGPPLSVMREFFFGGKKRVPKIEIPVESPIVAWRTPPSTGLRVTWFGHSTLLLEIDGFRILTDPVFGMRASPVSFAGPKRFHPVPATIDQLPPLDVVLLTHDHHDHLNPESIRALATLRVPFVTSLGVGMRLEEYGVDPALITELDWWEETEVRTANGEVPRPAARDGTAVFTATPAQHFSGRSLRDRNKLTLWSSFVITTPQRRIFFSGDTGLTNELREIGMRFGPFDLTMIEIGAWHPAWQSIHLGPVNALKAFEMLGGGTLLPIHWGTFDLALHAWDEPIETLLAHAPATKARVITPLIGRPIEPAQLEGPTPWWRMGATVGATAGQRWLPALSD